MQRFLLASLVETTSSGYGELVNEKTFASISGEGLYFSVSFSLRRFFFGSPVCIENIPSYDRLIIERLSQNQETFRVPLSTQFFVERFYARPPKVAIVA